MKKIRTTNKNKNLISDVLIPRNQGEAVNDGSIRGGQFEATQNNMLIRDNSLPNSVQAATKAKGKKRFKFNFKILKRAILSLILVGFLVLGYTGIKLFINTNKVIDSPGDGAPALSGNISPDTVTNEGDGRINVLIAGIGGDNHEGGDLSDTNLVASIDPVNNTAGIFSIPRDLFVTIPEYGDFRINSAHAFGKADGFSEDGYFDGGMGLLQKTIEFNLDIPLHYYVRVDLEGFKQAVDAVGGISLNIEERLVDYVFNAEELGYEPPFVVEAGWQDFDGERALFYSRSRSSSARGDFDRNDRQREVIEAVAKKALSLGTFSDPRKLIALSDTAAKHVRTNVQTGEFKPLYELASKVPAENIQSFGLSTDGEELLANSSINGAAVLTPSSGNFNDVTASFFKSMPDPYINQEQPVVAVYNSTDLPGLATLNGQKLSSLGYIVDNVDNVEYLAQGNEIFNLSTDKPFAGSYLQQRFDAVTSSSNKLPPEINQQGIDFVIILGQ